MPRFFYSDCVITNIAKITSAKTVYSATINDRQASRLVMDEKTSEFLTGIGKGSTNRVWFLAVGLRKALVIVCIENSAGERHSMRNTLFQKIYSLTIRPLCFGFLAWFASWILLFIPLLIIHNGNVREAGPAMETLSIQVGVVAAVAFCALSLTVFLRLGNLDSWSRGDLQRYTSAKQRAFGS